jgi:hypothetical protein
MQPHDHEQAEDDLNRGGGPAPRAGVGIAAGQVAADAVEEFVVVEQAMRLLEQGLKARAESRDEREQIGPIVAVLEHAGSLQNGLKQGHFEQQTSLGQPR